MHTKSHLNSVPEHNQSVYKGGLISESFTLWMTSPKMDAKSLPCIQSERLSEIKPPLVLGMYNFALVISS